MLLRSKILAGIALVAVIGAVALASSGSSELSSSRWAVESGLPELPPARDNGWLILTAEDGSFELSDEPDGVIEARTAISDQSRSVDERWQALADARSGVSRMVGRSSHGKDLQRWHAASDAVAFADACSLEVGDLCNYFGGFERHRLAQLEIMDHALRGDWRAANEQLAMALAMDQRYLDSARSLMGGTVASTTVEADLGLAHVLLAQQSDDAPERDAVVAAVAGVDLESDVWTRSVIGGYLYERNVLEHVQENGPEDVIGDAWWPPHFLYDAHQTSEVLATVHHDLLSMSEPTVEWTLRDRVLNPLGCALVDPQRLHSSYAGHHENLEESLSKAERWRREILERWGEGTSAP